MGTGTRSRAAPASLTAAVGAGMAAGAGRRRLAAPRPKPPREGGCAARSRVSSRRDSPLEAGSGADGVLSCWITSPRSRRCLAQCGLSVLLG